MPTPGSSLLGLPWGDIQRCPRGWHVHGEHVHPQLQAALRKKGYGRYLRDLSLYPVRPTILFMSSVSTFGCQELL